MALYSQSQQQYLVDAINVRNPGAIDLLTLKNCFIGKPKAIPQNFPTDPNTEITVRGRPGSGYNGSQTFRYTRLSLSDLFKNFTPVITMPGIGTTLQAVANINGRYGLNLLPEDVVSYYLYRNSLSPLRVYGTSLQYTGSVNIKYVPGPYSLEELVVNNILNELNHPIDPDDGKKCGTMLAYGVDFTDEYQLLSSFTPGPLGTGDNFTSGRSQALVDMMESHGLPRWDFTGARVQVKTTANETRANKRFDRVLVITLVNDPDVAGDWLLHYNI